MHAVLLEELEALAEEWQWVQQKDLVVLVLTWAGVGTTAHSSFVRGAARGIGSGLTMASRHPKSVMGAAAGGIGYAGYRNRRGSQNNPLIGLE